MKSSFIFLNIAFTLVSCTAYHHTNRSEKDANSSAITTNKAAWSTIISATVGGSTGYVIGEKMNQEAQDIQAQVPGAKVKRVEEGIVVAFSSDIMFASNQFNLTDSSKIILNNLIVILNKYPETNLEVQGHTDNTGSESYNMRLSVKRAASVADYLKANGIAASRIIAKGFGQDNPEYKNNTPRGRAQNRRIEFLITANQQMKTGAAQEARRKGIQE